MLVVHVTTEDIYGAGRAAKRICNAEKKFGIDSYVFTQYGTDDSHLLEVSLFERLIRKIIRKLNKKANEKYKTDSLFHMHEIGFCFSDYKRLEKANIIHLHWVNNGFWSNAFVNYLKRLGKPIVWTMHDMWNYTGGCHYSGSCEKYINGCAECSMITECSKKIGEICDEKVDIYRKLDIQFVGCSNWITKDFNDSYIGKKLERKAICIHNPKPGEDFMLREKKECRRELGIKSEKKIILFGATGGIEDERKGFKYFREAVDLLSRRDYLIITFGSDVVEDDLNGFEVINLGYINDNHYLSLVYCASDVFVASSLQENLANTVLESMSCGTPVVAFNIGGMPDMIIDGVTGFLAQPNEAEDLARCIERACYINDCEKIIEFVNMKFGEAIIAKQYVELYRKIEPEV